MIENIIASLIAGSNKVIIPQVGAFLKNNNKIVFVPFLKTDDGSLSKLLSEALGLDKAQADEVVMGFAESLAVTLKEKGVFVFPEFGELRLDANGIYAFLEFQNPSVADDTKMSDVESANTEVSSVQSENVEHKDVAEVVLDKVCEPLPEQPKVNVQVGVATTEMNSEPTEKPNEATNVVGEQTIKAVETQSRQVVATEPEVRPANRGVRPLSEVLSENAEQTSNINERLANNRPISLAEKLQSQSVEHKTFADVQVKSDNENTAPWEKQSLPSVEPEPKNVVSQVVDADVTKLDNIEQIDEKALEKEQVKEDGKDIVVNEDVKNQTSEISKTEIKEDAELLASMRQAKSSKARLYDLYDSSAESSTPKAENISTVVSEPVAKTEEKVQEPTQQAVVNPNLTKSKPDMAVWLSAAAIALAVVACVYYFIVRL